MPRTSEEPPLSIASTETTRVLPPRKLGPHGMALWNSVMAEYLIEDRGGIELLAQACAAEDRAEALADAIARDGEVVRSRAGVPRSHPAVKEELALRAFICRTIERLGLNVETIKPGPGRPTKPLGWMPP